MLYTDKTLSTLEFDKICEMLADCALTEGAKKMALALRPTDRADTILMRQRRTTDARRLMDTKGMPSFGHVKDVADACERAAKGATLSTRELLDIGSVLRTSRSLLDYIRTNRLFETSLDDIFERLEAHKSLEDRIYRSIISEELIADEASSELADIRRKMRSANLKIKDTLQKYVTGGSYSKYLQENIVTMRNGRYVLPVKVECKNEIKGLLHDTSSSGATIFVEPMAVVEANNELRMLESREEHEIEKILLEMSTQVAEAEGRIRLNYKNITELAFIFACGELSSRMRACAPKISGARAIKLVRARHPLIDREKVVPVDVSVGESYDTLIITGPNTGGKTVTLKILGLFALMAQAGLHIPADESSELCVFDSILPNIGDEQSIEESLSTFSSHMVNIVSIVKNVTPRSLVLFDELGAGTDPVEGAALAIAIIESIRRAGAICASTTHYAELKAYALDTEGVCNASCEFDVDTLKPTYRLIIGTPGKSNAFAISTKLGLPDEIVERARTYVSTENKNFEDVIEKLEASRLEMDRNREEAIRLRREYEAFKADAEKQLERKIREAERETEAARQKAASMVESAKASSEFIFAQLDAVRKQRESERLGEELDRARREIRAHLRDNEEKFNPVEEKVDEEYVLPRPLRKGDEVYIINIGKRGFLIDDPDKSGNVNVQAGIIKTRTKIKNLKLIEAEPTFIDKDKKKSRASDYKATMSRDFSPEIDLRGLNGDEAWQKVDKYFDEATLAGFSTVHLIHGKGTGALKAALWKYLKKESRVKSFRIGQYGEGDGGVTVVELK